VKSFDQFRLAVLGDVSATVKETSATPPMHFLIENSEGLLEPIGPIWRNEAEKRNAPAVMKRWIRKQHPEQLAVVGESFSVEHPTEADRAIRPSENPRRRHLVSVWLFTRGQRNSEVWDADVLQDQDGHLFLGEWRALDSKTHQPSGELFDPVFDAMNEKTSSLRRIFG
jgi:hypothetical protein